MLRKVERRTLSQWIDIANGIPLPKWTLIENFICKSIPNTISSILECFSEEKKEKLEWERYFVKEEKFWDQEIASFAASVMMEWHRRSKKRKKWQNEETRQVECRTKNIFYYFFNIHSSLHFHSLCCCCCFTIATVSAVDGKLIKPDKQ